MTKAFNEKVKTAVAKNFDGSCRYYRSFEDRHGFFASLAIELADRIGLRPETDVLDVGCGNGASAQVLNRHFGCRVLGVDLSPAMVADGMAQNPGSAVTLVVGDGERLGEIISGRSFDYVLYNASIFIFPDPGATFCQAARCLRPEGKIAFSFYPQLKGANNEDLINIAFERLGITPPRFRVITSFEKACEALSRCFRSMIRHEWVRPLDIVFLQDFFSIPAQSTSLFPDLDYPQRRELVMHLFNTITDFAEDATIVWRMAEGSGVRQSSAADL